VSLDPNIRVLMANTVSWEQIITQDGYGDETYEPLDDVPCRIEAGVDAVRMTDGTVFVPRHILYFDGGDERVAAFSLRDRFTVPGETDEQRLQPKTVNPIYGPAGDLWLVEVTLA
jgi:hypothetical protein